MSPSDEVIYYRDRKGNPIRDVRAWAELQDMAAYHFLARDTLPNGVWVATIWEGIPHIAMFNTGVFTSAPPNLGVMLREVPSDTENDAFAMHAKMVNEYREK